jgi:geranylgeranylglycerol-phosphate geranylgeranyltransferase
VSYLINVFRLIRIQNCILAAFAVIVGGYLQSLQPERFQLYLFALIAALVCGAGNALNDRLDIEGDRVNHPRRPLPLGALRATEASLVALLLGLAGLSLSLLLDYHLGAIVLGAEVLLVWYNFRLKRIAIVGNVVVALLGAVTIISGGIASGGDILQLPGSLFPAALAFLLHLAREMTKDIQDLAGDRIVGFATYPLKRDPRAALTIASLAAGLMVILSLLPIYTNWYNQTYVFMTLLTVDVPLLVILILLNIESKPKTLRAANLIFKLGLVMGLLAVYLGGVSGVS